jgi:Ca2+-transporting ATPase
MEGVDFRKLPTDEMDAIIPRLQVLARSSPTDKQLLVGRLKALGETVAVTGDGTNDGPALKMADIGFSMGIAGTEVAKEASSIILMDDNFASIVKAMMWGRGINDSVKKFLQFQLTVNVTAVTVTFISAVIDSKESSVLTVIQLLWINLIMDSLAALALATEEPSPEILNRPPENKKAPLITFEMWRMVLGQSVLQVSMCLGLLFGGPQLFQFNYLKDISKDDTIPEQKKERLVLKTIIFNMFVYFQVFNMIKYAAFSFPYMTN